MKKGMLFMAALLAVAHVSAYKLTVRNLSKRQVELKVIYFRSKRNPPTIIKLKPGQERVYGHGLRCIDGLSLIPRSGAGAKGPFGPFDAPKLTGLGHSCASNKIRIVGVAGGGLVIEEDKKEKRGQYIFVKNKTNYPLQLKIEYFNMGVCPIEYARVKTNGTLIHKSGRGHGVYVTHRCCPTKIDVRTTRGPVLAQKWHTFSPKRTGVFQRQSCRDNTVNVELNPDGSLHLEDK